MGEDWLWLRALIALSIVMALLGVCALLARWWQQKQPQLFSIAAAPRRLKILETLNIDTRNKLVLVECNGSQQLLLLNPTQSMVVRSQETVSAKQSDS